MNEPAPEGLDLFGELTPVPLQVPEATKAALRAQGIEPPDTIRLLLRQATAREVREFSAVNEMPDGEARKFIGDLILRRAASGTDERVVREMVLDITPVGMANLGYAYTEGRLPDPKAQAALAANVRRQLDARRPAPAPSSRTSTGSRRRKS